MRSALSTPFGLPQLHWHTGIHMLYFLKTYLLHVHKQLLYHHQ